MSKTAKSTHQSIFKSLKRVVILLATIAFPLIIILGHTQKISAAPNSVQHEQKLNQLNQLMSKHYQYNYHDIDQNQAQFSQTLAAEQLIYSKHAAITQKIPLSDDMDYLLESMSALSQSLNTKQRDQYDFNGLKSASALGGGNAVCEHLAPAYSNLLTSARPELQPKNVLTVTRNSNFITQNVLDQTDINQINQINTITKPNSNSNQISTDWLNSDLNAFEIFSQNKPDHMLVQFNINIKGEQINLFADPTNPSFWYSDGKFIRNLNEPQIYMVYSQLGQTLFAQESFASQDNYLNSIKLNKFQLVIAQKYFSFNNIDYRLQKIIKNKNFSLAVKTISDQDFRKTFIAEANSTQNRQIIASEISQAYHKAEKNSSQRQKITYLK